MKSIFTSKFHRISTHLWILGVVTLIATFLRFYNLDGTLQFLGDQGRDALITYKMLVEKNLVFIGPVTSVGNMYLGPGYYYFMLPFYALTYPSPMGPVYAVALLGSLTVPLIYLLGKELIGKRGALIASILYAFTWTFIELTRFSWNPNPAPLISLIMIWAIHRAWIKSPMYWIIVGLCFSLLIQLHYLTLLTGGAAGLIWLFTLFKPVVKKSTKKFFGATFAAVAVFISSLIPLILFDLRHDYLNWRAFQDLLFGEDEHLGSVRKLSDILMETHGRSLQAFFEITLGEVRWLNTLLVVAVIVGIILSLRSNYFRPFRRGILVLVVWMGIGILGAAFYRSTIFNHYIGYLFPVTALLLGLVLSYIAQNKVGKMCVAVGTVLFIMVNIQKYVYRDLSWTINEMQATSEVIQGFIQPGEKYNVVLLAPHGDIEGMNYRYFLTAIGNKPPSPIEEWGNIDTLVVIDEEKTGADIANSAIYEIVVFPTKTPTEIIKIPGGPDILFLRR